ncbi:cytochrome c3 family protein [Selenomonas sp. KH1T6]|uniref:cytochrome c3 family protein n=1 Tax=Selenomonas sp. KH1T6 TaxID=3158784 RepID=UPI0008A7DD8B|nr:Cytochrome c3 [Selenomonas ruminantium]
MKDLILKALDFAKQRPLACLVGIFLMGCISMAAMHVVEAHFPEMSCSPCHGMETYVDGYYHDDLMSHSHMEAGVACIDCHDNGMIDKLNETYWYVTDDFDNPPQQRAFDNEMCTKCHKVEDIVAKTNYDGKNPHDSHLGDLVCSDCHYSHEKSKAKCMECHNFEFLQNLPPEWAKKGEQK